MCGVEPVPLASARLAQQGDLAGPSQCRDLAHQEHAVEPLQEDAGQRRALAQCLQRVGQAEALWGPDDCRTALELRRLAFALATDKASSSSSPPARGVPLWLRILEIELPALGLEHPDVVVLRRWVEEELLSPYLDAEVAAYYEAQLARICHRRDLDVGDPGAWRAGAGGTWTPMDSPDRCHSPNLAAAAASVGGAAAAEVGGAVVGAAVRVGLAAASSTCSAAAGVAGQVLGAAAQQAASAAVTAAAPAAAQQPLGWTVRAAGAVGSAAFDTARVTAGASLDVASQVAGAVTSSVAASTFSFAGRHAISGTAYAAQSAWGMVRSALSPDEQQREAGPAEAASAPAPSERPG